MKGHLNRNLVGSIGVARRSKIAKIVPIVNPSWLPFRVCSNDHAQLTGMPYIFFFKIKNCLNDDLFISCDDRIGKMLHNICISAVAMSLRWATRGPWASCIRDKKTWTNTHTKIGHFFSMKKYIDIFLISAWKHFMWMLIRIISQMHFWWAPTSYAFLQHWIFACWVILHAFLSSVDFFFKLTFSKKIFQEYHQSVKQFDPDQAWRCVRPDLGLNCLQRLSADDKSCHQRGKKKSLIWLRCLPVWLHKYKRSKND